MKTFYQETILLTPGTIDSLSGTIGSLTAACKIDKRNITQLRLLTENVLIDYMEKFGADTPCTVRLYRSFTKYCLSVETAGSAFNPLKKQADAYDDDYVKLLMENTTVTPSYQYTRDGVNQIRLQIPCKKPSSVLLSLGAIAAAFLFWFILSLFPDTVGTTVAADILSPVGKTYLSLLSTCGLLMIFLSLVSAVSRMNGIQTLKSTGNIVIRHIMSKNVIYAVLFAILVPFFFPVISDGAVVGSGAAQQLLDIILGIVPSNLIDPFREQNALQVSFMALVLGIFLLINKKYAQTVIRFFDELNRVILSVIGFICSFMPLYIFVSFSELLLSNHLDELKKCRMIPVVVILFACVVIVTTKLVSKYKYKVPLLRNFKNSAGIALTGFFTCSSMACLDANRQLCLNAYGVDEDNLQFSLIFQHVLYKADLVICFLCFLYGLCNVFGTEFSLLSYVVMTVSVLLLAMATPPVPGSSIVVLTPFLVSASMPDEAIAIFTTICVFVNMILVGMKVFCVSDELLAMDKIIKKKEQS